METTLAPEPTTEQCGACGQTFATLTEVFSHDCPALTSYQLPRAATTQADSVDLPDWGTGTQNRGRAAATKPNRYPGNCADCGAQVGAGLGRIDRQAGAWVVRHLPGGCTEQPASAPKPEPQGNQRPNRYAGACRNCGGHVAAEQGLLVGGPGNWGVEHKPGTCQPKAGHEPATELADVPAGHYAVASTGHNDLAFYRVDRPTEGRYAGATFVKLIVGGHPDQNVRRDHVAGILARIAADPDAAARYGRELGRCCNCNRTLTDELSRELGIGPECRKRAA